MTHRGSNGSPGIRARSSGAGRRLEDALAQARPAIRSVVDSVRALGPDEYEIEFGMKFNAESGVVIAKTAVEGHFMVKVRWTRPDPDRTA